MLVLVDRFERFFRRNPDQTRGDIQVPVMTDDVGIGMVDFVMGNVPDIHIGTDDVENEAKGFIDKGIFGIGSVEGIMADIESNKSHVHSQSYRQKQRYNRREYFEQDQEIQAYK